MTSARRWSPLGRRLGLIAAGALVAAAIAQTPALESIGTADRPDPLPCAQGTPSACPADGRAGSGPAPRSPAFGAYLGYGPAGVERIKAFGAWLDGADVRVGHTYLPGDLWSNIEGAPGFLDSWAAWRRARADRLLVLNVPLMERNEVQVPDARVRGLLRRAALGEFDEHFRALARRLVGLGVPDTVLVLGWEMNGVTYTHRCGPDPERWKAYWRRVVTAMRSVPGQRFRFDFAPSRGTDAVPWPRCYPGDDVVDIVGMDSYDQPEGVSFDEQVSEPYGLQAQVDFARAHGKPFSYPEWGLFRNGDNRSYMLRMLAWLDQHPPLYQTITDYCPHGVWQCSDNPRASAVYRAALSGPPVPDPSGSAVPTPPAPTAPPEPRPSPNPTPPVVIAPRPPHHCPCRPPGRSTGG
ncbi:glycoside hydrolase family 26 protein [Streptomyces bungoensis]